MIDPVLKKFGYSLARKSIKNLSNNNIQTPVKKAPIPKQTTEENPTTTSLSQSPPHSTKLSQLITYLTHHNRSSCPNHLNSQYKIKFICLQQSCHNNFICAECLIYHHNHHQTIQISSCLHDLQSINSFMSSSYHFIIQQKYKIKQQIIQQIDLQITHMQQLFHQNMMFFKQYHDNQHSKTIQQIDNNLNDKYPNLQILNLYQPNIQSNINSKINANQFYLITSILKMDMLQIQSYINQQLNQLSLHKICYQPFIQLFEQINCTLNQFISEYKASFPKIYKKQHQNQSILSNCKLLYTKLMNKSKIISQFYHPFQQNNSNKKRSSTSF